MLKKYYIISLGLFSLIISISFLNNVQAQSAEILVDSGPSFQEQLLLDMLPNILVASVSAFAVVTVGIASARIQKIQLSKEAEKEFEKKQKSMFDLR